MKRTNTYAIKRILSFLLMLTLFCACLPHFALTASAETVSDSIIVDDNTVINYTFHLDSGLLEISGHGYLFNPYWNWYHDFLDSIKSVQIGNGIIGISSGVFRNHTALKSVALSEGLTYIDSEAFENCQSLEEINIPGSVLEIGDAVFRNCKSLRSIDIPGSVTEIPYQSFTKCYELETVTLHDGPASIGNYAFWDCRKLNSISIPSSVKEIGQYAFDECSSLTTVSLHEGIETINKHAFGLCSLTSIMIPRSVSSIGYGAIGFGWNMDNGLYGPIPGFTIYGYAGTVAESYALKDSFTFVDLTGSVCPLGHTWDDGTVVAVPSCTQNGTTKYVCTVCGTVKNESMPALGHVFEDGYCIRCGKQQTAHDMFSDVSDSAYYAKAVLWAVQNGITGGTGDGKFSPKGICKREQVVTFLYAAANKPEYTQSENPFTDVKEGKYYFNPVMWALENKVTGGVTETIFGVGKPCTREQVVSFLWKAAGSPTPESTESPFTDVVPGKYYYKAVLWANENGITGGVGGGKFGVGKTCTRAQIVTFLYAAYGK